MKHTSIFIILLAALSTAACGTETVETTDNSTAEIIPTGESNPIDLAIPDLEAASAEVTSIVTLDTDKYLGSWYEVASIPQWFQSFCEYGVRAQYAYREDGNISVNNSCYDEDDIFRDLEGVAGTANEDRTAELLVSFISEDPTRFGGNYWVLDIDDDYTLAVVGEPTREFGWILSRSPFVSQDQLDQAFGILADQGYDVQTFELTDQNNYGSQQTQTEQ